MIIYKVTNTVNNKSYIGQTMSTLSHRKSQHIHDSNFSNLPFHRALLTYGFDKFNWIVLYETNDIDDLNNKEIYYINKFNTLTIHNTGYNILHGGRNAKRGINLVQCNICGKSGNFIIMKRWHFDNCKLSNKQKIVTCDKCGKSGGNSNMKRHHFQNCGKTNESRPKSTCNVCGFTGGVNIMKRFHFERCGQDNSTGKQKKIGLQ